MSNYKVMYVQNTGWKAERGLDRVYVERERGLVVLSAKARQAMLYQMQYG